MTLLITEGKHNPELKNKLGQCEGLLLDCHGVLPQKADIIYSRTSTACK